MEQETARQSWAAHSMLIESLASSPDSLSRASSPWLSQLELTSQTSSEYGDYASSTGSVPLSPTSIPLPPVSPSEVAPPEPVHAIVHIKAELEEILERQRKVREDPKHVQGTLHGVDYQFGSHLSKTASARRFSQLNSMVEQDLEEDAVSLEERRRVLVRKIAEMMNQEINQIKQANKGRGNLNLETGERFKETEQECNKAGSSDESEVRINENGNGDDDSYTDAVGLQEWQYGDDEAEEGDIRKEAHAGGEQETEETDIT